VDIQIKNTGHILKMDPVEVSILKKEIFLPKILIYLKYTYCININKKPNAKINIVYIFLFIFLL
jgi:hypothetical protein